MRKLPDSPGVYFFFGKKREILYIGKATSLKARVRSYFAPGIADKRSPLIAKMVSEIQDVKFQKTDSVLEALILEAALIKKLEPPYNTDEKDQKSWNYVVITKEKFPRVLLVRERIIHNSQFIIQSAFGPFPHSQQLKSALKIVRKIFPFRDTCKLSQKRGCFNYQLGLCPGVCIGTISQKEYVRTIRHIKLFFQGKKKGLVTSLIREMKALAKARQFEKAETLKRKIFALQHINDVSLIRNEKSQIPSIKSQTFRIEAYDIAHTSGKEIVGVMTVIENNEAKKSDYRMFKIRGQKAADDTQALQEVLERRFKHPEWSFPNLLVVDGGMAQLNAAQSVVTTQKLDTPVVAVVKDKNHKPREVLGIEKLKNLKVEKLTNQILLTNSEAHRFAINFHKARRGKAFLPYPH